MDIKHIDSNAIRARFIPIVEKFPSKDVANSQCQYENTLTSAKTGKPAKQDTAFYKMGRQIEFPIGRR